MGRSECGPGCGSPGRLFAPGRSPVHYRNRCPPLSEKSVAANGGRIKIQCPESESGLHELWSSMVPFAKIHRFGSDASTRLIVLLQAAADSFRPTERSRPITGYLAKC